MSYIINFEQILKKKKQINELKFLNLMREYMLFLEKFYTAGKSFTMPPVVPAVTNLTSAAMPQEKNLPVHPCISPSLIFPPKQIECQSHLLAGQVRALVTG